jgi:Cu2+-exporting ATPase
MKQDFNVTGMSCAACQARVEKAAGSLPGVESCTVSLLTNSMRVEGDVSPGEVIKAVEDAGYGAELKGGEQTRSSADMYAEEEKALENKDVPVMKKRLISSVLFLLVLMYFSMGHMMWNWPLPSFFEGNMVAVGILEMLLAGIIMVINQKFFTSGFKSLMHRAPNMDTLVAMGSMVSFAWSFVVLMKMTRDQIIGGDAAAMTDMHDLYFESAAMIVTLITVGKLLEAVSKGRTTDALKGLMKLAPKTAIIERNGEEQEVPIDQLNVGDIFIVRAGGNVPVDGEIIEGSGSFDESALTGESIPVDKEAGDRVSAATVSSSGYIKARALRVGRDTTLSQIIQMVSDAAATKAPIAKIADRVSGIFVPAVLLVALATFLIWLMAGGALSYALSRGIAVLVVSCPCALGLATPVAIMVGNGKGAKNGILFKTAASLEETGRIDIVALDKTGTITEGHPVVTDVLPAEGYTEEELLTLAGALEAKSEHPLARAVMDRVSSLGQTEAAVDDYQTLSGSGVSGIFRGNRVYGGNARFISTKVEISRDKLDMADRLSDQGKTCLYFTENGRIAGLIAVADTIKEDSAQAVKELQNMGIHVVMLTGDHEKTARAIGKQAGVDEVIAGVLPDGKESVIRSLQKYGKVAMVGDGINDAPALTRADTGIAIGAGADVAVDAADVVLMNSKLTDVSAAVRLSRATLRNIHENLFWAFFYNVLLMPLAAGAYAHLLGITMNPMLGAAAMSLSSFCVVTNALRLNLFKLHNAAGDRKKKHAISQDAVLVSASEDDRKDENLNNDKGENDMKKTMKIEGMMCEHCEATVKKALEALDGVERAEVSHEAGQAVVTMNSDVADADLKKAVEDKDYEVKSIA